jgi:hypothetical protein
VEFSSSVLQQFEGVKAFKKAASEVKNDTVPRTSPTKIVTLRRSKKTDRRRSSSTLTKKDGHVDFETSSLNFNKNKSSKPNRQQNDKDANVVESDFVEDIDDVMDLEQGQAESDSEYNPGREIQTKKRKLRTTEKTKRTRSANSHGITNPSNRGGESSETYVSDSAYCAEDVCSNLKENEQVSI